MKAYHGTNQNFKKLMENLKNKLLIESQAWNFSGEFDDTEFAGRFFMTDTDLDEFAKKHGLTQSDEPEDFDRVKIEKACDCKIIYDYKGVNPNRQFGDQEIIF